MATLSRFTNPGRTTPLRRPMMYRPQAMTMSPFR
jgi:hypothetical protein